MEQHVRCVLLAILSLQASLCAHVCDPLTDMSKGTKVLMHQPELACRQLEAKDGRVPLLHPAAPICLPPAGSCSSACIASSHVLSSHVLCMARAAVECEAAASCIRCMAAASSCFATALGCGLEA